MNSEMLDREVNDINLLKDICNIVKVICQIVKVNCQMGAILSY